MPTAPWLGDRYLDWKVSGDKYRNMVKIGRCPKNYGLTKVQARRVEKEREKNNGFLQNAEANESGDGTAMHIPMTPEQLNKGSLSYIETGQGECYNGQPLGNILVDNASTPLDDSIPVLAIAYPNCMEKSIADAEFVTSKFFHAHVKGKRQALSLKSARIRVANSLKVSLRLLSDHRHMELMRRIAEKRRDQGKDGPCLYTIHKEMDVGKTWTARMTRCITAAVVRLERDLPRLTPTQDRRKWAGNRNIPPVPPLILDIRKAVEIANSSSQREHRRKNCLWECNTCLNGVHSNFQKYCEGLGKDDTSEKDSEESPRDRLQRKIIEHGFDIEIPNSGSQANDLSRVVVAALLSICKKSRRRTYDVMTRDDRREALRESLVKNLQASRLLPIMLRHLKHRLEAGQDGLFINASSDMNKIILSAMAQSGLQHVTLFNITCEFLGSDIEAFFARQECYFLWSSILRAARLKLSRRWRAFIWSFTEGHEDLQSLAFDIRRYSRLAAEQLLVKMPLLIRDKKNEECKRNLLDILHRYSKIIRHCVSAFAKVMLHLLTMQYSREAKKIRMRSDNLQMSLLFAFTGFQDLQTELLSAIDDVLRRVRTNRSTVERPCTEAVRNLLSKVILRAVSAVFEAMKRAIFVENAKIEIHVDAQPPAPAGCDQTMN